MNAPDLIQRKVYTLPALQKLVLQWKYFGKSIAFTNGCFDIIHQGHIFSLSKAASEADFLIVGLNSDESVERLKGPGRPVNSQDSRAIVLASLVMVDAVVIFEEDTPLELIKAILPDVMVKGGDYRVDEIAGAGEVIAAGGRVIINPILKGFSTTSILRQSKT
ncbi:MAG: D-glycero-beta-D-manno-heptose 1-phosphate adenylyltransferase [Chitinophagaceae bacterium]|nr:D-glycero-beta-D-manno-heptose 1-phosphate adenylyltransferase [Chitinophagaceae bacterium]